MYVGLSSCLLVSVLTALSWNQIFRREDRPGGLLQIYINNITSKETTTAKSTVFHVADHLCNVWQGTILSGCRDTSSQSFMNLATVVVRLMWAEVGRRGGLCIHIGTRFGQDLGSKITAHSYAVK